MAVFVDQKTTAGPDASLLERIVQPKFEPDAEARTSAAIPVNVTTPGIVTALVAVGAPTLFVIANDAPLNDPVPVQPQAPSVAQLEQAPIRWPSAELVPSPSLQAPARSRYTFRKAVPEPPPRRALSDSEAVVATECAGSRSRGK